MDWEVGAAAHVRSSEQLRYTAQLPGSAAHRQARSKQGLFLEVKAVGIRCIFLRTAAVCELQPPLCYTGLPGGLVRK